VSKIILVGSLITVVLFIVGIILLSFFDMFSDYWIVGVGLIGLAIVTIVITLVIKFKKDG